MVILQLHTIALSNATIYVFFQVLNINELNFHLLQNKQYFGVLILNYFRMPGLAAWRYNICGFKAGSMY